MRKMIIELGQFPDARLRPNSRVHWTKSAEAKREARALAKARACQQVRPNPSFEKAHITVTFVAKDRRPHDLDNLFAGMKSYVDGLRDAGIIVNDTASRISYTPKYVYERGPENNTIIEIQEIVPEHDCVLVSGCCQANPAFELDGLTGHCGKCYEIAGFECEEYEDCPTAPWI